MPALAGRVLDWLTSEGLAIALIILGAVLIARGIRAGSARYQLSLDNSRAELDSVVRTERNKHRRALMQVLEWTLVVVVYIIAALLIVSRSGVPTTGLVVPGTVVGAALGFGAQSIVRDLLAGFFIIAERQYGFGDVVKLSMGSNAASGTVEDVTLRVTKLRSNNGEVITVPNGGITEVVNSSKDWARAVIDVPVPVSADVSEVTGLLRRIGAEAYADPEIRPLLLDQPTVMGVEAIGVTQMRVRIVASTQPGKQFEVGRDLRARIVEEFNRAGLVLRPEDVVDTSGEEAIP